MEADVWSSFKHDPRNPGNAALRASDADRAVVQEVLGEAYADGRLDHEELDTRTSAVTTARTLGELPPLLADLVADRPAGAVDAHGPLTPELLEQRAVAKYRSDRREAVLGFLGPSLVCVVIWALTGAGFFWPGFVIVFTFLNVLRAVVNRSDMIENNKRKLLAQQQKEIRKLEHRPDDADTGADDTGADDTDDDHPDEGS